MFPGVFQHGNSIILYRTFHNVKLNGNQQIYSLLCQLERAYEFNNSNLPETIYVQIDGGAENVNKVVLGMLALLVAKRVGGMRNLILTRLPVGHTHEDIDSIFGVISRWIYKRFANDPQSYAKEIRAALAKKGIACEVIDIFCVPDFESFITPFLDENFSRFAKEAYAIHQFMFKAVNVSFDCPVGVEMSYRKYVSDEYPEVVEDTDPNSELGVKIRVFESKTFPEPGTPPINILLALPGK